MAQSFRVEEMLLFGEGRIELRFPGDPGSYYRLIGGRELDQIDQVIDVVLDGPVSVDALAGPAKQFFRVERVPRTLGWDTDGDGLPDVYELSRAQFDPLDEKDASEDFDGDQLSNIKEYLRGTDPEVFDAFALTRLEGSSPANGESNVSLTRETILRLDAPLSEQSVPSTNTLYAEFGGRRVLSRLELGTDRESLSLFYHEPLPASARVWVTFDGDTVTDFLGRPVDADGDGTVGGAVKLAFSTSSITPVPGTVVVGHVYASEPVAGPDGNSQTNQPLQGVIITVDGAEQTLRTTTDSDGFFRLEPAPAGRFFVHVDGREALGSDWPNGAYYPFVGKAWETSPGSTNNLAGGSGEIFLPLVPAGTLQSVSSLESVSITFAENVLAENPSLEGVAVEVPPNALFSDDGTRGGRVGIAPVPADRLPEPLPPGLDFPLVITVQTDGPQNFSQPAPVRFPNLPDPRTGEVLPPGAKTALFSFNHDTGRWEIQGSMTVTVDGLYVESDPGVGILQPGWHGTRPGTQGFDGPMFSSRGDNNGDVDEDGLSNDEDDDIDGDGVSNELDTDMDGDGVPNNEDSDRDGDGAKNGEDNDTDGDGIDNVDDSDIDGDGTKNGEDSDVDGDGVANEEDSDVDGDGTPNGLDDDIDGDGTPNELDEDMDGDGVDNNEDLDRDGDGIPNSEDADAPVPCDPPMIGILEEFTPVTAVCPNERVTFHAESPMAADADIRWSGGAPVGLLFNGLVYTTAFTTPGMSPVTVELACSSTGAQASDATFVTVAENSGAQWVSRFPGSRSTDDLAEPFQSNVNRFLDALTAAGANVHVSATHRPYERAFLMHWAHNISTGIDPRRADNSGRKPPNLNICWEHLTSSGVPSLAASTNAATAMATGYGIAYAPSLSSLHILRRAIDMTITWTGDLEIMDATGTTNLITSLPRHGGRKIDRVKYPGNTELHAVGATYGVIKLLNDPPHWSDNGN